MSSDAQLARPTLLNQCEHPTRKHYIILSLAWAGWLFDFYDLMLLTWLKRPIIASLHLGPGEFPLVLGTSLAATAAGGLIFGWLADRFGRKTILSATIITYSLGTFCCGLAGGLWTLLLFRIVTGMGVGGEWATGQTIVGETFPPRVRARFAAIIQTGAPAGIALAAIVGSFAAPVFADHLGAEWGWRVCFLISVIPAGLVIFVRQFMPESDVWQEWQRRPERREQRDDLLSVLRRDRALRRLFLLGLVLAITDMSAYWFTYSWMPDYLMDKLKFSLSKSGWWMLAAQGGGVLGYLSFGVIADWKGRRIAYMLFSLIWAIGLASVTLFWSQIAVVPMVALFFMFLVGVGTGNFSGYGPIFSELFPTRIRNTAMGAAFNLARGVQFLTPLVIGWVAALPWISTERALGVGISIGAFFALFTGLWVWTLPETRGTRILAGEVVREG